FSAQMDLLYVDWIRLEFDWALSRMGRNVGNDASGLFRMPLTLNALGYLPMEKIFGDKVAGLPLKPYGRVGMGLSWARVGEWNDTHPSKNSLDTMIRWGVGVDYPIGKHFDMDRIHGRVDIVHDIQFESRVGHFVGVNVGASYHWPSDQDADGILDIDDACPEQAEDPDGFEDADGCPEADNDGDGLLDDDDGCPLQAEDVDGYKDEDGCPDPDNDGDGILDGDDQCPMEAEDKDGFEDEDGCPELDNDGDNILDTRDKCPMEPEDVDGYQDMDGCPDPDNDGDKILDADDACPMKAEDFNGHKDEDGCPDAKDDKDGDGLADTIDKCIDEAEDKDGFEDEDGCPDPDNDGDTVLDAVDACPDEKEDLDGFQDEDGCPEYDNDGDGIWDEKDECPNEPETVNGMDDIDGCPDEGAQLVVLTRERIEIRDKVYFEVGSDILQERSFKLLEQIAALLKNHTEVERVEIQGHTDGRGGEKFNLQLSDKRAKSVARYLEEAGIEAKRVIAKGYGESLPVASNDSRAGREMNRRVEFMVVGEEEEVEVKVEDEAKPEDEAK
ncbi:OmpA family protein, partial [Myxococcota bacterium]|nr:OmpA family protein [Myxococcota bacterium]